MNLPNRLSLLRIILVPILMFFYFADFIPYGIGKLIAIVLFIVAAFTDMLDGRIARKNNLVTDLGKLLDPIADKLLTTAGLLLVACDLTIPFPYSAIVCFIIFGRDVVVSGIRQIASSQGQVIAAHFSGKLKAIFLYTSIPCLMLLSFNYRYNPATLLFGDTGTLAFEIINWILLGAATILTAYSCFDYVMRYILSLKKKKTTEEK